MLLLTKCFWTAILLIFLSGCSTSFQRAHLPGQLAPPSDKLSSVVVERGTRVKIELIGGETLSGEVVRVSEEELTLEEDPNFRYDERVVRAADIVAIEMEYLSSSDKRENTAITIGAVLSVAIVAFIGFLNAMSKLG